MLFEQSTFTVHRGYKVGLVGANGTGKTSLFEVILGHLDIDQGEIDLPATTRIAHMAQEVHASDEPAVSYVLGGDEQVSRVIADLEEAESSEAYDKVAGLHEQMHALDGYSAKARAEQLLVGLGFSQNELNKSIKHFSGGWRIRLNLARTLMSPADLLLLDEPTNHLDMDAIIWLSEWIRRFDGTLLLISHDREFLDECVGHIAYLHQHTIELFTGNYTAFENLKAERLALQQSSYEKQQREIAHMQDFVRRFRAKATKARQAQSRLKALARMEKIAPAHVDSPFSFTIKTSDKVSSPLLTLSGADLGYDKPVLTSVNLTLLPGDRIGLLGVNGAGKSTLIKSLRAEIPLLKGERTAGANLGIAYFSQHQMDELDLSASALEHLYELGRSLGELPGEQAARNFLGGFNFHGDKALAPVSTFSGGQKARLALALITYTEPNLILMDEPTNHLDIDMRQALTVALQDFAGAIILVSHDRHLMTNTVDRFVLLEDGQAIEFSGDLDDYRMRVLPGRSNKNDAAKPTSPDTPPKPAPVKPGKQARQIRTRLKTLDDRISRLQRKLKEVDDRLSDPAVYEDRDNPELQPLLRDQTELKDQLEVLEDEWLQLSESLEQ